MIPGYMEREKQLMKANTSEKSGKILLQTSMVDANGLATEATMASILEIARTDLNRYFEFFYSTIDSDNVPVFVGIRAVFGFGPDSFSRFRAMVACPDSPFVQLATDTSNSRANRRPREVARNFPSYGWGCATMREFMGFVADFKIAAPKGQLFLTLRGQNNAWEEVYRDARRNPGRDTLQQSAKSINALFPKGRGPTD